MSQYVYSNNLLILHIHIWFHHILFWYFKNYKLCYAVFIYFPIASAFGKTNISYCWWTSTREHLYIFNYFVLLRTTSYKTIYYMCIFHNPNWWHLGNLMVVNLDLGTWQKCVQAIIYVCIVITYEFPRLVCWPWQWEAVACSRLSAPWPFFIVCTLRVHCMGSWCSCASYNCIFTFVCSRIHNTRWMSSGAWLYATLFFVAHLTFGKPFSLCNVNRVH